MSTKINALPIGELKDCRFYFRLKMVEALCNFRFEPSGDGFKIIEPETGCVWFGSKNDGGQWIFTLERDCMTERIDMVQPIYGDEYQLHVGPYSSPKPDPTCDECKDDGPADGSPCKKCGYQRF